MSTVAGVLTWPVQCTICRASIRRIGPTDEWVAGDASVPPTGALRGFRQRGELWRLFVILSVPTGELGSLGVSASLCATHSELEWVNGLLCVRCIYF